MSQGIHSAFIKIWKSYIKHIIWISSIICHVHTSWFFQLCSYFNRCLFPFLFFLVQSCAVRRFISDCRHILLISLSISSIDYTIASYHQIVHFTYYDWFVNLFDFPHRFTNWIDWFNIFHQLIYILPYIRAKPDEDLIKNIVRSYILS